MGIKYLTNMLSSSCVLRYYVHNEDFDCFTNLITVNGFIQDFLKNPLYFNLSLEFIVSRNTV